MKYLLICALIAIVSCTKNSTQDIPPIPPKKDTTRRLLGWAKMYKNSTDTTERITYFYDANNRIIQVANRFYPNPTTILWNITYNLNQVTITAPERDDSVRFNQTINLQLNDSGIVTKRTMVSNVYNKITKDGGTTSESDYFEYDISGLLIQQKSFHYDSSWDAASNFQLVQHSNTTFNYTNNANNIISSTEIDTTVAIDYVNGSKYDTTHYTESYPKYDYTNNYDNKTDFSNSYILPFLGYSGDIGPGLPLNKKYKNFMNGFSFTLYQKNKSGGIIHSLSDHGEYTLTYDAKGYLSTLISSKDPSYTIIYLYSN